MIYIMDAWGCSPSFIPAPVHVISNSARLSALLFISARSPIVSPPMETSIDPPFPIRQLSPEIIGEIFYIACEDYRAYVYKSMDRVRPEWPLYNHHERRRYTVTPGVLSQVCRTWKDIAYHTPMLWDTVRVDNHMPHYRNQWRSASFEASMKLKKWLQRAGSVPLTIKVEEIADGPGSIITELLLHSNQWKDIDIYCPAEDSEAYSKLQAVMRQPLPLLTAFTCRPSPHWTLRSSRRQPPFSIRTIPNLTNITIFRDFPISVSQCGITTCKWVDMDCFVVRENLREMGNLKSCSIYSSTCTKTQDPNFHSVPPPLLLSFVDNFALSALQPNAFHYIMQSLSLPALRRAYFSGYEDDALLSKSIIAHIISLLQRSNYPALQALDLDLSVPQFDVGLLLDLLHMVPILESFKHSLGVYGVERDDEQPSFLRNISQSSVTLGRLTTCSLDMSALNDEDQLPLLKYLILPALQEFEVFFPSKSSSQKLLSDLRDLVLRSNPALRSLKLVAKIDISEQALLELLKVLPNLENLQILASRVRNSQIYFGVYDDTGEKLTTRESWFELLLPRSRGDRIYLPRLRELSCEGTLLVSSNIVFDALEYRWRGDKAVGIRRLQSARIFANGCGGELTNCPAAKKRLAVLSSQGMDIIFTDPV
ncbi:hypothetical protein BDQ17DRAFT_1460380 [Cyathus striatus]|nr:hypothetical protein BDQ17DRAFT_1460380 [Cyathus striatus]